MLRSRRVLVLLPGLVVLIVIGSMAGFRFLIRETPEARIYRDDMAKIMVSRDGLYRLELSELRQLLPNLEQLNAGQMQLTESGNDVAFHIDGDSLFFYGHAPSNRFMAAQPYLLRLGQPGTLMAQRDAEPSAVAESLTVGMSAHFEKNIIYDSRASMIATDNSVTFEPWFWSTVQVDAQLPLEVDLEHEPVGPALVRLRLWGVTSRDELAPDHDLAISVNGRSVGEISWDGEEQYIVTFSLPPGLLRQGQNRILLDNSRPSRNEVDISRLDWIDLDYQAVPLAVNDRLLLRSPGGSLVLAGFNRPPLVLNVSEPDRPELLVNWTYMEEEDALLVETTKGASILAVGPAGWLKPEQVSPVRRPELRDVTLQADLLIITTDALASPLEPLLEARRAQGLRPLVVPADAIYDEFGDGSAVPDSIAEFLQFAATQWAKPRPRYVLLIGDATYDYRGYLGRGPANVVPAPMIAVDYSGETISDSRLADLDGDGIPELSIGRWPVGNIQAVKSLVDRTLSYEDGPASGRALFTADGTSLEFASLSNSIIEFSDFSSPEIVSLYGNSAAEVVEAWNQGAWFVSYVGHGSLERWGKDDVFTTASVESLAPQNTPPIVVQLTCLTGYFAHPSTSSLGEVMLMHDNGPVLTVAATSLTLSESQTPFAINLLTELGVSNATTIGEALTRAKRALNVSRDGGLRQVSETFTLLGDPSAPIVRPEPLVVSPPGRPNLRTSDSFE